MTALEQVSHRFGDFALRDITLEIGSGEYWVLLGPSGSGKSLLLETIAGFHVPERGRVLVDGVDVTRAPPEARRIGLVVQRAALFPHYSVLGNIEYGLRARQVPAHERKRTVADLVARLRLEPVVTRPVATLSGGEAQRVAIARALAVRPALLLLDEPLSMVDHNARIELQTELKRLHRELGTRTLHVTHSREEAAALGDHCAVILSGRIVQQGRYDELMAQPRCSFVARFLGIDRPVSGRCDECRNDPAPCDRAQSLA